MCTVSIENVDGVLGIRIRGRRMVGEDICAFNYNIYLYTHTAVIVAFSLPSHVAKFYRYTELFYYPSLSKIEI